MAIASSVRPESPERTRNTSIVAAAAGYAIGQHLGFARDAHFRFRGRVRSHAKKTIYARTPNLAVEPDAACSVARR